MLKKIGNFLFSIRLMGVLILIFAVAIGVATFIENDYSTATARVLVYDTLWFEILFLLLTINLIGNFVIYRMFRKSKLTIFLFHLAFIIILIGAAITRYLGFEGSMHIRENEKSNVVRTYDSYLQVHFNDGQSTKQISKKVTFADGLHNDFNQNYDFENKEYRIRLKDYTPNATESLIRSPKGSPILTFQIIQNTNKQLTYVRDGESRNAGNYRFGLNTGNEETFDFQATGNEKISLQAPDTVTVIDMAGDKQKYEPQTNIPFRKGKLYRIGTNTQISYQQYYPTAKISFQSADTQEQKYADVLRFNVTSGETQKELIVRGAKGASGKPSKLTIDGTRISLNYGAKKKELPFSLKLKDFKLERYPGSKSPSSFESEVVLIDKGKNIKESRRIYMNNVLKHRGYRFYQSSYDQDEKGTILSVNHDLPGTVVTYIGYILLTIGMITSLFNKNSRFQSLVRQNNRVTRTAKTLIILGMLTFAGTFHASAQKGLKTVDYDHARKFGRILVQDKQGRVEPMNTLGNEIVRKVTRKTSFKGLHSDQVFLGIISQPDKWKRVPMIKVGHEALKKQLGIEGDYAAFTDFIDEEKGQYMIRSQVEEAHSKKPAARNQFDKEIIKVDERVNIFFMASRGQFLKIFPKPGDLQHSWYTPNANNMNLPQEDSLFVNNIFGLYLSALLEGNKTGDYAQADKYLQGIKNYQLKYAEEIIPPKAKRKAEIWYNNVNIFLKLGQTYGLLGLVLLILLFTRILSRYQLKWPVLIFTSLISVIFALHILGLGWRWYLSGHAPWSNGYESLIYIAFATMLAGVLFVRRSPITMAATAILSSIILMVAHLSWMDPEITNLVPVLKSYWLTIHVSVITASYGFFGLGALLGFISLLLNLFKTEETVARINEKIKQITTINEMTLTVGLYMLTIGTFLGGVWANESWGRYWGWDPKETWALVSVLVYAFIIHMRMMPGLKSRFTFNMASVIGFGSIIMTYFGVNYYLSGMHSYAKGDPVPIPVFVYYVIATIVIVGIFSYINDRRYRSVAETKEHPK
ncbi:MAG: cytochrome c biogenesis protein CcsA [Bacteroidales bacterium]|nr:cytochrome c biogenesis protein CcsA [Bacteroidales bacterium]MCF8332812.1 cytochrome c biogenesis protein CcsA [Bacteroidales bacterium]